MRYKSKWERLDEKDIEKIRYLSDYGLSCSDIATRYGVDRSVISRMLKNERRKSIVISTN
jgi:IS30 family transposase